MKKTDLRRIHDYLWEIPKSYRDDMRVPARVYTSERMLDAILADRSLEQLVNVTTLPESEQIAADPASTENRTGRPEAPPVADTV